MNVCYCQRIHIATALPSASRPITESLGWFYAALLTRKRGAFVHWHFHFGPLSNWVTGAHHVSTKEKEGARRGREILISCEEGGGERIPPRFLLLQHTKWNCVAVRPAFSHQSTETKGDPETKRKCLVRPICCQLWRTCSGPPRSCVFYLFFQGNSTAAAIW